MKIYLIKWISRQLEYRNNCLNEVYLENKLIIIQVNGRIFMIYFKDISYIIRNVYASSII